MHKKLQKENEWLLVAAASLCLFFLLSRFTQHPVGSFFIIIITLALIEGRGTISTPILFSTISSCRVAECLFVISNLHLPCNLNSRSGLCSLRKIIIFCTIIISLGNNFLFFYQFYYCIKL